MTLYLRRQRETAAFLGVRPLAPRRALVQHDANHLGLPLFDRHLRVGG